VIIYGDFTCPFSYLASRRADLLPARPRGVEWRAVESDPHLPAAGLRFDASGREEMTAKWSAVRALLLPGEALPGQPPAFLANTQGAVAGYAEAVGAGVPDRVRAVLFHAYWVDGADIGNPEVLRVLLAAPIRSGTSTAYPLRQSGYAVSMARGPITNEAFYRIRAWRAAWQELDDAAFPALVDGEHVATGAAALAELGNAPSREHSRSTRVQPGAANSDPADPARGWSENVAS
jgi:hypothetical protein